MIRRRRMTLEELRVVLDWAADEGWNPGLDDAGAFRAADPKGFFVAMDGDAPVAAISVVNHCDDFAFLGLYLCRPDHRGRGIGHALWRHAIARAGDRTIGLDGVPDQQGNYAKSGFVRAGETVRYAGSLDRRADPKVRPATPDDIPALVEMEAAASGWAKPAYLSAWFAGTRNRQTFIEDGPDGMTGMVTIRRCRSGSKIGPLVAHDEVTASRLLFHAATLFDGPFIIDVPSTARKLDLLCQDLHLEPGFQTARMYKGAAAISDADLFAASSLELG